MKKAVCFVLILALTAVIAGCAKNDVTKYEYNFTGENASWAAFYKISGTETFYKENGTSKYKNSSDGTLTVKYKKNPSDLDSVKKMDISYESRTASGGDSGDFKSFPRNGSTFTLHFGSSNWALENKNDIIKVKIACDGKAQTIDLKSKN